MLRTLKERNSTQHTVLLSNKICRLFHIVLSPTGNPKCGAAIFFALVLGINSFFVAACSRERSEDKFNRLIQSAEQYKNEGKFDAARLQLQSAIDIKPKDANAHYKLAEVLIRLQKVPQAVENYNSAINYDPNHIDARLHLAAIMLANRQYEMAENHIRSVLERDAQNIEALILQANLEAAGPRKDLTKARQILLEVLAREAQNAAALATLGNVELAQGNAKEAEDYFTKAIRLEPANAPLQMALADIYNRQGRLDEAQGVLEELVKKNPQQTGLHFVLAEFLLKRGLPDRALEQYSETLKSDAKRHDARDRLYDMYLVRSMIDEAKKLTADLEKQLPDDPGVAYFRGRDLELAGKIQPALDQFLEAVKLLNNFAPAFRRAGLAELRLGKETQGIEHLNQAIAIDPGETSARYALAQRLFSRKELAQATEHLKQILMRHPRHLGANVLRADIALIEGDTERARKVYEYLLAEFPKEPAGYFKMALLEEKENNYAAAIDLYRKLLSFDRGVLIPAQRLLALIASHEKKDYAAITAEVEKLQGASENSKAEYDLILASLALSSARSKEDLLKARALFEKSVAEKPELIGAYFGLAQIDAATGDLEAAAQSYNKLLQQNPKHVPTMMMLALTLERQEKHKEAADTYREILKLAPNFGPALNNLAWLLVDELNGNLDEALNFAESAKEQLPKEASVADTLAWVHFKRGSFRAAEPIIEEALELEKMAGHSSKPNPEILYHLAEIKTAAGEKDEARQAIKQALELAPPNHPKRSKMEELKKRLG